MYVIFNIHLSHFFLKFVFTKFFYEFKNYLKRVEFDFSNSCKFLIKIIQIYSNFCHFEIFGPKNSFFSYTSSASTRSLLIETLVGGKICIFGFFMVSYACSVISEEFHQILDDQKAQKHHENHLAATFCHSKKYLWENAVLRGQMSSKWENSTWVGKHTSRAFQKSNLSSIWMPESASKSA